MRELGYLANVLLAGVGSRGGRLRPLDAAEAAVATCSLGLERALADLDDHPGRAGGRGPDERPAQQLARLSCDVLFRVGWRLLLDEVALPAAAAIDRVATRLCRDVSEADERAALERLALAARTAVKEGRPASLATRLDRLAGAVEEAPLALLAALSDDIPALCRPGSPLERIASVAQLRRARSFLDAL
jgi:hypothetical protein